MDGLWCDDKEVVKDKVRNFFKSQFDGVDGVPVRLDNASFSSISGEDNKMLVEDIFEEEVKFAVWSCDSSKSPGPDNFNFWLFKIMLGDFKRGYFEGCERVCR